MLVAISHPYLPDSTGTQCLIVGCWGWVDDPRHTAIRRVAPVVRPLKHRSQARDWSGFDRCFVPSCAARAGEPCRVAGPSGRVARRAHQPHVSRRMKEVAHA